MPDEKWMAARVWKGMVVVPGSVMLNCERCRHPVAVAPTGQARLRAGCDLLCVPCGVKHIAEVLLTLGAQ